MKLNATGTPHGLHHLKYMRKGQLFIRFPFWWWLGSDFQERCRISLWQGALI